jgi:hypothetical protein
MDKMIIDYMTTGKVHPALKELIDAYFVRACLAEEHRLEDLRSERVAAYRKFSDCTEWREASLDGDEQEAVIAIHSARGTNE